VIKHQVGRHVFGIAILYFGIVDLFFHDYNDWEQLKSLWLTPGGTVIGYLVAACMVVGGLAVQWRSTARGGAIILAVVFLFFGLRWAPEIIAHPGVFDGYGAFFEEFSIFSGVLMIYATSTPLLPWSARLARLAYYFLTASVISFTIAQAVNLDGVASFTPKWIPPGQMFWAVVTTVAFALAAVALLLRVQALLAARLTTLMILGFGLLLWLPRLLVNPHSQLNWGGNGQNMAIAGAVWIVADYLATNNALFSKAI
jgi:hypothetical protein